MSNISVQLFDQRQASDNPDLFILVHGIDAPTINFEYFKQKCFQKTNFLHRHDIYPGSKVLLAVNDVIESVGVIHALLRLGCNIYFVDYKTSIDDISRICQCYQTEIFIGDSYEIFQISGSTKVLSLTQITNDMVHDTMFTHAHPFQDTDPVFSYVKKTDDGCFELCSFSHCEIMQAIKTIGNIFTLDSQSRVLNLALPLSHPVGTMITALLPFYYCSTHALIDRAIAYQSINRVLQQQNINFFVGTPFAIDMMVNHNINKSKPISGNVFVTGESISCRDWHKCKNHLDTIPFNLFVDRRSLLPIFCHQGQSSRDLGVPLTTVRISQQGTLEFLTDHHGQWIQTHDMVTVDDLGHYGYVCHRDLYVKDNDIEINCLDLEDLLLDQAGIEDCAVRLDQHNQLTIQVVLVPGVVIDQSNLEQCIGHTANWHWVESIPRTLLNKKVI